MGQNGLLGRRGIIGEGRGHWARSRAVKQAGGHWAGERAIGPLGQGAIGPGRELLGRRGRCWAGEGVIGTGRVPLDRALGQEGH